MRGAEFDGRVLIHFGKAIGPIAVELDGAACDFGFHGPAMIHVKACGDPGLSLLRAS